MSRICIFSGAGISAESGLPTFRDAGGLWKRFSPYELATPEAFAAHPRRVLDFYNDRRAMAAAAEPNAAHLAIARLESRHEVTVVTQNIDDLHERAGSSRVIHLHGQLREARCTAGEHVVDLGGGPIGIDDRCPAGHAMRPNVVWFGEMVPNLEPAGAVIAATEKLLVVGTSLTVYPAAGLVDLAPPHADRHLIALEVEQIPSGFTLDRGTACAKVPPLVDAWMQDR